ncbi:MAG: hypothetical protein D3925_02300 [Candidatus Electrothrix sp. AR5]|nr:hypothetical protein [Candidatus Electrothrix sp. AR5]
MMLRQYPGREKSKAYPLRRSLVGLAQVQVLFHAFPAIAIDFVSLCMVPCNCNTLIFFKLVNIDFLLRNGTDEPLLIRPIFALVKFAPS